MLLHSEEFISLHASSVTDPTFELDATRWAQAVLVFYIFGKETKVVNDISGYHADNPNAAVHVGDA